MNNWSILDVWHFDFYLETFIRVFTNSRCHLTLYYTDKRPWRHKTSTILRGLSVPWGAYFCFVAYKPVEQLEAGDTLTHTFLVPDWAYDLRRWFSFRGTVDGDLSPSGAPIFEHTNQSTLPRIQRLYPNASGVRCLIPYENGYACPHHWKNVNEHSQDGDLSCVYTGEPWNRQWIGDLYNIDEGMTNGAVINSVNILACIRRQGGMAYVRTHRIALYTHGRYYLGDMMNYIPTSYVYRNWLHNVNPFTLYYWSPAELNDLQIGIFVYHYRGVGWSSSGYCTQIYAEVTLHHPWDII